MFRPILLVLASLLTHSHSYLDVPKGLTPIWTLYSAYSLWMLPTVSSQSSSVVSSTLGGSECPNACSGHGACGPKAVCYCFKNWMANDCSQRVCPFGLAHVDTPKGDLDQSKTISGINSKVIKGSQIYPNGTTELYPRFVNSGDTIIPNTGHEYAECSNKGFCDREFGICECISGYEGSACQRMICPQFNMQTCSNRGMCKSKSELAQSDHGNIYELWDKHSSMGCECDPGFYGPACNARRCVYGYDPMFNGVKWASPR